METMFGHIHVSNSEIGYFGQAQGNQRIVLKTYGQYVAQEIPQIDTLDRHKEPFPDGNYPDP